MASGRKPSDRSDRRSEPIEGATPPRALEMARFESGDGEMVVLAFPIDAIAAGDLLTPAEHAVVAAIEAGKSNGQIAEERGTSTRTVANQIASIYRKLKVGSRAELVATRAVLREAAMAIEAAPDSSPPSR